MGDGDAKRVHTGFGVVHLRQRKVKAASVDATKQTKEESRGADQAGKVRQKKNEKNQS